MRVSSITSGSFKIVSVLLVAVLLFAGCSKEPLGPTSTTSEPVVLSRSVDLSGSAQFVPGEFYAEQVISAETGGTLTLLDVTLDIPAGAVPNDTLFSIAIPDLSMFYNEFGTSGLEFQKPVTVTMSYRSADLSSVDESTIRIGFFNERTGEWEDVTCDLDPVNKTVTGQLMHFSAYGLISD